MIEVPWELPRRSEGEGIEELMQKWRNLELVDCTKALHLHTHTHSLTEACTRILGKQRECTQRNPRLCICRGFCIQIPNAYGLGTPLPAHGLCSKQHQHTLCPLNRHTQVLHINSSSAIIRTSPLRSKLTQVYAYVCTTHLSIPLCITSSPIKATHKSVYADINSLVINTLPRHWDLSSHVARDTFSALQGSISMWHLDSKNSYTGINDRQLVIYSGHWGESRSNMERIHSSLRMKHLLDHLLSSIVQHCHYFYLQRWGLSVLFCFFILFWIWDLGCKKQFQFLVYFCIWKAILIFCF